ncbi:MAG: DUF6498-containing protein [Burkholderiales bacterium]
MAQPPTPLEIGNTVFRNIVPLGGILFLGWSAPAVLVLYFADTLLAMAVMFAGLMRHFMPPPKDDGWAARANAEAGCIGASLFIVAFMAVPLGVPLIFMLAGTDATVRTLFADEMFRGGLVLQAIAALWSGRDLYRALKVHTPEELRLKRRFALALLRWVVVIMATYFGLGLLPDRFAPIFFVAVYAAATIVVEIAPDRFLRAFTADRELVDPLPGAATTPHARPLPSAPSRPPKPPLPPAQSLSRAERWRRRHKR